MKNILIIGITNILISVVIYLIIVTVLIIIDKKRIDRNSNKNTLSFHELAFDYSELPELNTYISRDERSLKYRVYPSESNKILILIHGSGWHSTYLLPLAKYISSENLAKVYTPDLRGHGINPANRGDINYINQLEDDLADFVSMAKKENPSSSIIIGGHSSGGGLVIRFAGSKYKNIADAYMLFSPFLKYNSPTIKLNSGNWAIPHTPRIIGLSMLNNIGISWFNFLQVIDFNMPEEYRDGTETLTYSYRLNTGFAPRNYKKDLRSIEQETLVLVGTSDESFIAEEFNPEISKYKKDANIVLVENVTHMGIVVGNEVQPIIKDWISNLD
jgi:non-heme chloroperoxidase